jgi:hypothetical protein
VAIEIKGGEGAQEIYKWFLIPIMDIVGGLGGIRRENRARGN